MIYNLFLLLVGGGCIFSISPCQPLGYILLGTLSIVHTWFV